MRVYILKLQACAISCSFLRAGRVQPGCLYPISLSQEVDTLRGAPRGVGSNPTVGGCGGGPFGRQPRAVLNDDIALTV
jgi:hypothetical protein